MSAADAGGPAFPILAEQAADGWAHCGMTLRDYFAAKAMQSMLINFGKSSLDTEVLMKHISEMAYAQSEAMLEARK